MIDSIVVHAQSVVADDDRLESYLRCYFSHVAASDLEARAPRQLFGLAADHLQLGAGWTPGTIAIQVSNPRLDTDGWESNRTIVMMVTDDLPFLVDSVIMELNRMAIGIHLVAHPVLFDRRDEGIGFDDSRAVPDNGAGAVSFMAIEIDRQSAGKRTQEIKDNLLRVLGDVRCSVEDWAAMRDQMRLLATEAPTDTLSTQELDDGRDFLRWLADDHFIFLGYREYSLTDDSGEWMLGAMPQTGLGILRSTSEEPGRGKAVAEMGPAARDRVLEARLLNLTKASSKATVHRASYLDYVGVKKFDDAGQVVGERRFLGLFTSDVYSRSVFEVPVVRHVVGQVVERAGFPAGGHDEKRLVSILETYPRDELMQIDADELFDIAMGITELQERRRVRVFARRELFGRFVTCLVFLPRDRYNTTSRTGIEQVLLDSYGGSIADWSTRITESVLARLVFLLRVDERTEFAVDTLELEDRITSLIQQWDDDFSHEITTRFAEDESITMLERYADAFPPEYRSTFDARTAVADIEHLEGLADDGGIELNAYREPGRSPTSFKLKLYRRGDRVSLTTVMPILTNLGVTVLHERPYEVRPHGRDAVWLYDFSLEHRTTPLGFDDVSALIEGALTAVWQGDLADDEFNHLVLAAGIAPAEIRILRAYSRYIAQTGSVHSQTSIAQTLEQHADVARMLVDLFMARFDPDHEDRETTAAAVTHSLLEAVNGIESLDQDRIVRRFHNLVASTLRTNFFQTDEDGNPLPYLAIKLDPTTIDELPEPRPQFEIFVYSARFEGVHLRAGSVARGGLRWSDRVEDYRTEVLGLVKAQMVKNAVIVPAGAKGGFVVKRPPTDGDPAALREEVVACYRAFVSGLLELTDNLVDDEIHPPPRTVRYDGDDPYLVVAADKGTATFSDISNQIAVERGFWLGDAFASGGSNGYDHKAMGITARGAWESVKRHFREFRRDIQSEDFSVVGVGDMSGDVFGNGMMQSHHTRLVAAFDHRHIFVDPDPDPARSFDERARLFGLPRSSWADYDESLISSGGGVFPRTAKIITLSDEVRTALDTDVDSATPDELISIILRAPV
ncbi:MAG: NAD-glutamate dehydrogenase domain-containing protein, partial [Acidimicrobiales bacterium]